MPNRALILFTLELGNSTTVFTLMQSDALSSPGTESDDTFNADFDNMDIVDISFLDCRDMNVDEYRGDNQFDGDSDSNDEDHWKNDYPGS